MNNFFNFFIKNSKFSTVLTVTILVMGLLGLMGLRRETRPAVDFARVSITTQFPGASAQEVEEQVTLKIEEQIRTVDGIKESRSLSAHSMSNINVFIDLDNIDTLEVVDELRRAVFKVKNLPSSLLDDPYFFHFKAKEIPVLKVLVQGNNSQRKRDEIAFQLKTYLERDPGIASIQLSGYKPREFRVILNPDKLNEYHVSVNEVAKSVTHYTKDISAGVLRSSSKVEQVNFFTQLKDAKKMENIIIRSNFSGQKVLLKDLGRVEDKYEDPQEMIRFNGDPITYLTITKKEKEDSIVLSNRIQDLLKKYSLPKGYKLQVYDDEANRTKQQLSIVINNAWVGMALVLFVLLLLLPGNLGFLSALSLPISILGTIAICSAFDITFNTITMLAFIICIGMLVDNAVVMSENYARLRMDQIPNQEAALSSVSQLYKPVTATVLTTISAFLPMLVTKGIMGQFIMWIPIMVCVSLMMNLFDAFLLLPSRLQWTIQDSDLKAGLVQGQFQKLTNQFSKFTAFCIRRRYLSFITLLGLIAGSVFVSVKWNEFILFPKNDVRKFYVYYETKPGTSVEKTDQSVQSLIDQILDTVTKKEIKGLLTQSGGRGNAFYTQGKSGEHTGEMWLLVKDDSYYRTRPMELLKKFRAIKNDQFEVLRFDVSGGGPPVGQALHVVLTSFNREDLKQYAKELESQLSQIPGIIEIENDWVTTGPEYHIRPRTDRLAELRLNPLALGETLQMALKGYIAGEFIDQGETFYVRVYYDDQVRSNIDLMKKTKIQTPTGSLIPLGEVIDVQYYSQGNPIRKRYDFQPSVEVQAKVKKGVINSYQANQKAYQILEKMKKKHPSVSYTFLGENRSSKESLDSLRSAMVLALFGIFIILLLMFKGFMVSILALSSTGLGLIGVNFAFALHQRPLSFIAMVGVVGLTGVLINSSIILLSFIDDTKKKYPHMPIFDVLVQAARFRFKPIVITTFTTVCGLFPAAYSLGGSDHFLIPMTLAFTWGLFVGSLLTLIWIPCGYAIIEDIKKKFLS